MGKRKSARSKLRRTKLEKLETRFDCPICSHENVVHCRILKSDLRGIACCSVCESQFTCNVTALDKPVDIYHAWIDKVNDRS